MLSLLLSLALALAPADYAGHWTLDMKASTGLPAFYSRVKSHQLTIAQSPTRLDVGVDVDLGGPTPDHIDFHYPLDGSTARTETTIRTPAGPTAVPTTLQATAAADGTLHIVIARTITMPDGTFTGTTTEGWSLSADGRTLTVTRDDQSPRGAVHAVMVFVKG